MAPLAGFNARVSIGLIPAFFAVSEYNIESSSEDLDVTNTEARLGNPAPPPDAGLIQAAGFFQAATGAPAVARITLRKPSWDPNDDPFATPFNFKFNTWVNTLKIFPAGLGGVFHYFPSNLIIGLTPSGNVRQLQPIEVQLRSDGYFSLA